MYKHFSLNSLMDTYLGPKGYTIPKALLSVEQQKKIKQLEMTIGYK